MLEVGNLPTLAENRSHFAMWTMLAAPLIAGTDIAGLKPEIVKVLTNPRLIAIDQDGLGVQAFPWLHSTELDVWARPLSADRWAIAVLNRSSTARSHVIDWRAEPLADDVSKLSAKLDERKYGIVDAWTGASRGDTAKALSVNLAPRDTAVFILTPQK
jgi:alpha-galactosidase